MGKSAAWLSGVSILIAALMITGCSTGTDPGKKCPILLQLSIMTGRSLDLANGSVLYYTKTTGNNLTLWRAENLSRVAAGEKRSSGKCQQNLKVSGHPSFIT